MEIRAGLYLRISKDLHDGAGVDRQREDGLRLIEQRGWTLHKIYIDNDISAAGRRKRPDYRDLMSDLHEGVINAVVSRSFERLCKTRREQLTFVELGQEKATKIAFTHAPDLDLTTAVGRGMADIMAAWARLEMEQKSERHIDQIAQAARQGRMVGGRRAFGYTDDGLHLNPDEAPVLVRVYEKFLTGVSLGSIARWLNELGITTPRGSRWRHQSVREVLANPRNAAIRGMRPVANKKTGTRSQWHVEIGPAVWPAVVSQETWRATMKRIKDPYREGNHAGFNSQKYLLTGIALCGVCERPLVVGGQKADVSQTSGGKKRYRVLRCPSLRHISRRADYIEGFVEEQVIEYFRGQAAGALPSSGDEGPDLAQVRNEAITVRERLRGLARDYADGALDRDQVQEASTRLRNRLAELDTVVAAAGRVDVTARLRASEDPEEVWDGMSIPEQREVLRRICRIWVLPGSPGRLHGLRFHPDSVRIDWFQRPS